ncbi:MAG: efflux RND transporter periplasmic adaptor subunit [Coxiellaceae bacterium]|nr:MAG: efflux RND transporter periplasmic adaptor subunit [Coxiellaceae bacterium]
MILASSNDNSETQNTTTLSAASQQMAGIVVTTLQPKGLTALISAPGEVIPNANLTTKITTRVAAQVIQRHIQEGEHVKEGQLLVTMSSVDMAKTQGDFLLAAQEWERVKSLGKDAVSGKRYSEAQVSYQRAYSTALAYGMTESEISELLRTQKPSQAKGEFNLMAPRNGTVFNINFTEGELIEPGRVLLQIVDEATVWVDAKLPPDLVRPITMGDTVRIVVSNRSLIGHVTQVHHQLDETTRTRSIRIEVPNENDLLHPGQFVNCQIEAGQTAPILAVPVESVVRTADGDWAVYIEKESGAFQPAEVKVVEVIDNQAVIEGISAGTRVVTKGTFFIHSELSKKGFDAHGH